MDRIESEKMRAVMRWAGPRMMPQPVLIIGTYNEDGTPNAMNAAWGGQWDRGEIMISMGSRLPRQKSERNA